MFSSRSLTEWRSSGVALACGLLCCSCSFVVVTPPPARPTAGEPRPHIDCTTSNVAPIVDSVITGYEAFRVGYAVWGPDSAYRNSPISRDADMALGAAFGAAFLASAVYGFVSTSRCRRMRDGSPPSQYLPGVSRGRHGAMQTARSATTADAFTAP